MLKTALSLFICILGLTTALPASPIIRKLDQNLRYQHVQDGSGEYHLVDLWMTLDDVAKQTRYDPIADNVYHLFTRENPTASQPIVQNNNAQLASINYKSNKRTIVIIHGWRDNAVSDINTVLVPAFLAAEDVNVIVVDWSAGAGTINYAAALSNTVSSGIGVARFIDWLNQASGSNPIQYHVVGQGLGGHLAAIASRHCQGTIAYVTALDAAIVGWINHSDRFQPNDGLYTEVIHTNSGINGFVSALAQVDFYPNGGESMPGCSSHACDHQRGIFYFAESIASGGFTGRQCLNYLAAVLQQCSLLPSTLQMGGLRPKIGYTGVYLLETNAAPPFSRG